MINFQPPHTQSRRRTGETLTIHREIFEIIDSDEFWTNLTTIAEILYPYCKMLNILQRDNARLVQVIHSLAYLVQFWKNHTNPRLAGKILARLDKRWNNWEQPLLILACLLHPKYRMIYFKDKSVINYSKLGKYGARHLKTSNTAPPLKFSMHVLRSIYGGGSGYVINKIINHMIKSRANETRCAIIINQGAILSYF